MKRGRKSAEFGIVAGFSQHPAPPEALTDDEAEIWRTAVSAFRPDWFGPENYPLLTAYCRHVAIGSLLAKRMHTLDIDADLKRFARLAGLQRAESSMVVVLARQLRMTIQSSRDSRIAKRDPGAGRPRPWETGD